MNIYEVRFVNNDTEGVVKVTQYGNSKEELEDFWKKHFRQDKQDKYTFIDAFLLQRNVDFDECSLKEKHRNN